MVVPQNEKDIFLDIEKTKLDKKILEFRNDWIAMSTDDIVASNEFGSALYNIKHGLAENNNMNISIIMKDIKDINIQNLKNTRNINISERAFNDAINEANEYFNTIKV